MKVKIIKTIITATLVLGTSVSAVANVQTNLNFSGIVDRDKTNQVTRCLKCKDRNKFRNQLSQRKDRNQLSQRKDRNQLSQRKDRNQLSQRKDRNQLSQRKDRNQINRTKESLSKKQRPPTLV